MRKESNQLHTLPELFNAIFNLYITRDLSHSASNLLFSLLYKFNQIIDKNTKQFFPETLSIYNFELAKILGIKEKTLIKIRNELTDYRLVSGNDDTWITKYESGGTREAGFYSVNYHLLENIDNSNLSLYYSPNRDQTENSEVLESQDIGIKIDARIPRYSNRSENGTPEFPATQKNRQNVQPFSTKLNETKQNKTGSSGPGSISSTESSKVIHDSEEEDPEPDFLKVEEKEFSDISIRLIERHYNSEYFRSRKGLMPVKRQMLIDIGKYTEDKIIKAIEKKGMGLKNAEFLIPNVLEELKNNNGHKPDIDPVKVEIEKEKEQLGDALVGCKDKDEFWKLLKMGVEISSIPNPVEYLFNAYKPERIKLEAKEDFEWFTEYCKGVQK